jgi:hypothetical protein
MKYIKELPSNSITIDKLAYHLREFGQTTIYVSSGNEHDPSVTRIQVIKFAQEGDDRNWADGMITFWVDGPGSIKSPHVERFSLRDAGIVENTYNDHRAFFTFEEAVKWNRIRLDAVTSFWNKINKTVNGKTVPDPVADPIPKNDGEFIITVREPERVLDL